MQSQKEFSDPASPTPSNTMPLVDVNLITYNHEKFIARAIDSVLNQKTNFNYRLILGDDCSTDNTQSIIRDYAQRYPARIQTVLAVEHRGIKHPNRMGIDVLRRSTAKYVALLDGDDYWTNPTKLQRQVDFLERHPECSLCFHNVEMYYDDESQPPIILHPPNQKEIATLEDVINGLVPLPCTAMFRKNLLGDLSGSFYKVPNADWMMWVMLAQQGFIGYINEVMAAYRIHVQGIWSRLSAQQRVINHIETYRAINAQLNYKYDRMISEIISAAPRRQIEHEARVCLDQYHRLVRKGEIRKGLRLLWEATNFAPLEVLRPRRLAVVLKNGFLGAFWKDSVHS
ncbi:MAG TPA: glycosyltransferase [Pyrinomonadaceae bacterium]